MSLFSHPVRKLTIIAALAGGYVLGAKAGRERYEQIRRAAAQVKDDPRVQNVAAKAENTVADVAKEAAAKVSATVSSVTDNDSVSDLASEAADKTSEAVNKAQNKAADAAQTAASAAKDVADSEPVQKAAKHLGESSGTTDGDHIDVEEEIVYTTGPDLHDEHIDVESDRR